MYKLIKYKIIHEVNIVIKKILHEVNIKPPTNLPILEGLKKIKKRCGEVFSHFHTKKLKIII